MDEYKVLINYNSKNSEVEVESHDCDVPKKRIHQAIRRSLMESLDMICDEMSEDELISAVESINRM